MRVVSNVMAVASVATLLAGLSPGPSFAAAGPGRAGPQIGAAGVGHVGAAPRGVAHIGGAPGPAWHGGGGHGGGWGPAVGAGVAAGVAAGAIAGYAASPYNNCYQSQPVYDLYGNYLGSQTVNVCGP